MRHLLALAMIATLVGCSAQPGEVAPSPAADTPPAPTTDAKEPSDTSTQPGDDAAVTDADPASAVKVEKDQYGLPKPPLLNAQQTQQIQEALQAKYAAELAKLFPVASDRNGYGRMAGCAPAFDGPYPGDTQVEKLSLQLHLEFDRRGRMQRFSVETPLKASILRKVEDKIVEWRVENLSSGGACNVTLQVDTKVRRSYGPQLCG